MGDVENIGDRYYQNYNKRIWDLEVKITNYHSAMETLQADIVDPAELKKRGANKNTYDEYNKRVGLLYAEIKRLQDTLNGLGSVDPS